jgi:putative endonuclease
MLYIVYILKSETHNRYYYGYTSDIEQRLLRHNEGLVKSTKAFMPWRIHYMEKFKTKSDAIKRENFFKSIDGYNWLKDNKIT